MRVMLNGNPQDPPKLPGKLCWQAHNPAFPIRLYQRGIGRFNVQYGLQSDQDLNYAEAAAKLGEAIMHALACEGELDNRERRRA